MLAQPPSAKRIDCSWIPRCAISTWIGLGHAGSEQPIGSVRFGARRRDLGLTKLTILRSAAEETKDAAESEKRIGTGKRSIRGVVRWPCFTPVPCAGRPCPRWARVSLRSLSLMRDISLVCLVWTSRAAVGCVGCTRSLPSIPSSWPSKVTLQRQSVQKLLT